MHPPLFELHREELGLYQMNPDFQMCAGLGQPGVSFPGDQAAQFVTPDRVAVGEGVAGKRGLSFQQLELHPPNGVRLVVDVDLGPGEGTLSSPQAPVKRASGDVS